MTVLRTFNQQLDIWVNAALVCYGFKRSTIHKSVLKKCYLAGLDLLQRGKPAEARSKIYGTIEREYQRSIWDQIIKTP